jgi:hypothetical protein
MRVKLAPPSAETLYYRGMMKYHTGDPVGAEADYRTACEMDAEYREMPYK